jgi:hypothetical protein
VVDLSESVVVSTARIVKGIDAGQLVIFPYDRSGSHYSTNLNGSAAHYCVIVGYAKPTHVPQSDTSAAASSGDARCAGDVGDDGASGTVVAAFADDAAVDADADAVDADDAAVGAGDVGDAGTVGAADAAVGGDDAAGGDAAAVDADACVGVGSRTGAALGGVLGAVAGVGAVAGAGAGAGAAVVARFGVDADVNAGANHGKTNINIKWLQTDAHIETQANNEEEEANDDNEVNVLFIFQHSAKDQLVVEPAAKLLESNGQLLEPKQGSYNVKQWKTDDMNLAGRCVFVTLGS